MTESKLLDKVRMAQLTKYAHQYRIATNKFERKRIERDALTYIFGCVESTRRAELLGRYRKLRDMQ